VYCTHVNRLCTFDSLEFWDDELRLWVSEPSESANHDWSTYNATIGLTDWGRVMIEIVYVAAQH
jgi:hypothetical protein